MTCYNDGIAGATSIVAYGPFKMILIDAKAKSTVSEEITCSVYYTPFT